MFTIDEESKLLTGHDYHDSVLQNISATRERLTFQFFKMNSNIKIILHNPQAIATNRFLFNDIILYIYIYDSKSIDQLLENDYIKNNNLIKEEVLIFFRNKNGIAIILFFAISDFVFVFGDSVEIIEE